MIQTDISSKRLFILDTNVLMHDPTALFRFQEHDVYLPMVVLEEMDAGKKGISEVARNVRQVSRFLDELMRDIGVDEIEQGIPLNDRGLLEDLDTEEFGRLFFQTHMLTAALPDALAANKPDNNILGTALALQNEHPDVTVTLVSKDINLRIKAAVLGIHAEDYYNDRVLEDVNLLFSGSSELPQGFEALVRELEGDSAVLETAIDYRGSKHTVWGISARNREQNFALNLLMDPEVDFVSLVGTAGTGKTLLALAAGLTQTLEENRYKEIIMTRVTVPVGEDIGFLPGTEEEKMTPWMGALMDNLEVLTHSDVGGDWGRAATNDLLSNRIKIRSMNFMRGRPW
jgi:PhoH-like ATPase